MILNNRLTTISSSTPVAGMSYGIISTIIITL